MFLKNIWEPRLLEFMKTNEIILAKDFFFFKVLENLALWIVRRKKKAQYFDVKWYTHELTHWPLFRFNALFLLQVAQLLLLPRLGLFIVAVRVLTWEDQDVTQRSQRCTLKTHERGGGASSPCRPRPRSLTPLGTAAFRCWCKNRLALWSTRQGPARHTNGQTEKKKKFAASVHWVLSVS